MITITLTAFWRQRQIAQGTLSELLQQIQSANIQRESVFIFNDRSGKRLDIPLNADIAEVLAVYPELAENRIVKSRGRPKLGVSAKEASLRALFSDDEAAFMACIGNWPQDIRQYALRLAFGTDEERDGA